MPIRAAAGLVAAVIFALPLGLAGCAAGAGAARPVLAASLPDLAAGRALPLYSGNGTRAQWASVVAACAGADVVLLGEAHGVPSGQAFEAALFEDLLALRPGVCAALEFFERDHQAALDDFVAGFIDEEAMRKATARTPGGYPPGHRAIVLASKAAGRPVVAANAPRRYVRRARLHGFDHLRNLTPEQARLIRIPDVLPTDGYRDRFFEIMRGEESHGGFTPPVPLNAAAARAQREQREAQRLARIEAMFRSQSVWDWTMAESVARTVGDASPTSGRPVVLVVGGFHVERRGGLVQALDLQRPGTRVVTIACVTASPDGFREQDRGAADYVVYIGPAEPARAR